MPCDGSGVTLKGDKLHVVKGNNFVQGFHERIGSSVAITACANGIGRAQQCFVALRVRLCDCCRQSTHRLFRWTQLTTKVPATITVVTEKRLPNSSLCLI